MKEVQMEARCSKCGRTFMVLMDDAQGALENSTMFVQNAPKRLSAKPNKSNPSNKLLPH